MRLWRRREANPRDTHAGFLPLCAARETRVHRADTAGGEVTVLGATVQTRTRVDRENAAGDGVSTVQVVTLYPWPCPRCSTPNDKDAYLCGYCSYRREDDPQTCTRCGYVSVATDDACPLCE